MCVPIMYNFLPSQNFHELFTRLLGLPFVSEREEEVCEFLFAKRSLFERVESAAYLAARSRYNNRRTQRAAYTRTQYAAYITVRVVHTLLVQYFYYVEC